MKQVKPFYRSKAWRKTRVVALIRDHHLCQVCMRKGKLTPAIIVHHIEHLEDCPEKALDLDNLESVCGLCHNQLHPEKGKARHDEAVAKDNSKQSKRKALVLKEKSNEERV